MEEAPINAGWEAVIHDVPDDPGKVLKLFNSYRRSEVEKEVRMTKTAAEAGLPCPVVYGDVIELNDRFGFYMEKIQGRSFQDQGIFGLGSDAKQLSEEFARFHVMLHEREGVEMPRRFKDVAGSLIRNSTVLSVDERAKVLDLLDSLPDGDRLCHGDFHPGNVMRRNGTGELVILDWYRAMTGHPLADVARASAVLSQAWLAFFPGLRWLVRLGVGSFIQRYEEAYFKNSEFDPVDIEPWRVVVAGMLIGEIQENNKMARFHLKKIRKYFAMH